jgi:hypothetical protein
MPFSAKPVFIVALSGLAIACLRIQAACPDEFSGTALGPAWTFVDADNDAASGSANVNGKLELTGRGKDVFKDVNEFVGVKRTDITGDFDVSVKIESQTNAHGWAQAGILAATDLSHLDKGGYAILDVTPANGYNLFYDAAEPMGGVDKFATAGKSGYPVWIRLAKKGKAFSAWYRNKADAAWTVIAEGITPLGAAAPSQIALVSLSHNAAMNGKTVFDEFACLHEPATAILAGPGGIVSRNEKSKAGGRFLTVDATGRIHFPGNGSRREAYRTRSLVLNARF